MHGNIIHRALASCRRVLLLLLLIASASGAWAYWNAPDMGTIRPEIERFLEDRLALKEVRLGNLSWYWAGFLWLNSDQLDFSSKQEDVSFHNGGVAVRIPIWALLTGEIKPDRIRLNGGTLSLRVNGSGQTGLPAEQIILEDVTLQWFYQQFHGTLPGLRLTLNGRDKNIDAVSTAFTLHAQLGEDSLPERIVLHCKHLNWLPQELRKQIQGNPDMNIAMQRKNKRSWQLKLLAASEQTITLLPESIYTHSLNRAEIEMSIKIRDSEELTLERVDITKANWSLGDNSVTASGNWHAGLLSVRADSAYLAMPLIWSWLRPLGNEQWQNWLAQMQAGSASKINGELALAWQNPLKAAPASESWQAMQYKLAARIEGADIALGLSEDFLLQTTARVELNQHGLSAEVFDSSLPRGLGHSSGSLHIPWQTLELHVQGQSQVDVASLLRWFGPSEITDWKWNQAKADSTFELIWDPSDPEPKEATATLRPINNWNVAIHDASLKLSGGTAHWDQQHGLSISDTKLKNEYLQGTLSLSTSSDETGNWKISSLDARGDSDLASLAAHFQLPLSDASGIIRTHLQFDKVWSGNINMKRAGWQQLLGSSKRVGEPYSIQYKGDIELDHKFPTIHLSELQSRGNALLIRQGDVEINREAFKLVLKDLHTPSFSGSLNIDIPFDERPWQLKSQARYLNRNALPASLDHPDKLIDKSWIIDADIEKFEWNDARMDGVHINIASAKGSLGQFRARQVSASQLNITDVDARFSLPGQGAVDLRQLSAHVEKQVLTMSASLTPVEEGGMRWSGFAELEGDFGHLMQIGKLSKRFSGGDSRMLFSGRGIMLRNQPWWQDIDGRMRLRVDKGRVLEGGTLTTLLAAINLTELHKLLFGQREDLSGPGIMYERLQMEAIMQNQDIQIRNVVLRSSAFDLAGQGNMDINKAEIDLYLIAQPLQNLDALLGKIPLLRDILGGKSHSLMRKVYHMHGPFTDATVETVGAEEAGLASPGIIESLFSLPKAWFGSDDAAGQGSPNPSAQ